MSFGGSETTENKLPSWVESAAQDVIAQSQKAAQIGYVPYMGPDVAAFSPMQTAAFDGMDMAASAYGLPTSGGQTGLPTPTTYAGGVSGYSSYPIYADALEQLKLTNPEQYAMLMNPYPAQPMAKPTGLLAPQPAAQPTYSYGGNNSGGGFTAMSNTFK